MSRSKRGGKSAGYEFWSRRPGSGGCGRIGKIITHRRERIQKKDIIRKEKEDFLNA